MHDQTHVPSRRLSRSVHRFIVITALLSLQWAVQCANAAVFTVNSPVDIPDANPGDGVCETVAGNHVCTLRAAVMETNALTGADTIDLQADVTYLLTIDAALEILDSVDIMGAGAGSTIIDGNNTVRSTQVFNILRCRGGGDTCDASHPTDVVNISGLTMQHGSIDGNGGAIYNKGNLTIDHCVLTQNKASAYGGAVQNDYILTVANSTTSDNIAGPSSSGTGGGGISNSGMLNLKNSVVSGNKAGAGGGIYSNSPLNQLIVIDSTISGNVSTAQGGGVYSTSQVAGFYNATIAFNQANADNVGSDSGGGIYAAAGHTLTFINSILSNNQTTVLTGSFPLLQPDDCAGTLTSQGHNIVKDIDSKHCTILGAVLNTDPQLGLLQDNGGPTFTHALPWSSPAMDAGNSGGCTDDAGVILTTDQRGARRPDGAHCDIGAYEVTETIFEDSFEAS